jgi:hypothetical protein
MAHVARKQMCRPRLQGCEQDRNILFGQGNPGR